MCWKEKVDKRYSGNGVFKKLDAHNIFGTTRDFGLATTIEGKLKEFVEHIDSHEYMRNLKKW
jgi:hypothetical protein